MWRISYIYSAAGEKLAKEMKDNAYQYYTGNMVYKNNKSFNYLLFDEGLVTKSSDGYSYEYHLKDHLGNTHVTFQPNGSTTTTTHVAEYYPFGSSFLPVSPAGTNKYLYNGKEKQDDILSGTALDLYDYGARFYDPAIGRWHCLDQLAEKYFQISPYNYVTNNPIKAIDPDGKVVIFVNGQHGGTGGSQAYWGNFATQVMNKIGDHNAVYLDGASGGWLNTATRGSFSGINLSADNRRIAGKNMARETAESIISNLKEGESIKIISHSMGAAYSKGYVAGLQQYAKKNHKQINIEFEVDFAPFQPKSQSAVAGIPTKQVSHFGDAIANTLRLDNEEEGADVRYTHPFMYSADEYSLNSFSDEIDRYVPTSKNNAPGESSQEENGSGTWMEALSIISSWMWQNPLIGLSIH